MYSSGTVTAVFIFSRLNCIKIGENQQFRAECTKNVESLNQQVKHSQKALCCGRAKISCQCPDVMGT